MSSIERLPWTPLLAALLLLVSPLPAWPGSTVAGEPDFAYPRHREANGYAITIHAPQIRSWPGFARFTGVVAVEVTPPGKPPRFVTADIGGETRIDMARRLVVVTDPQVLDVRAPAGTGAEYTDVVRRAVPRARLDVPLDLFLASVDDVVFEAPAPAGFSTAPPSIEMRRSPTLLLFVNGSPVASGLPGTGLQVLVNANWPTFRETASGAYYLLARDRWLRSTRLDRGWSAAATLPAGFSRLPAGEGFDAVRKAVPPPPASGPQPEVLYATQPTELIVTQGEPRVEAVDGAAPLEWVANTDSPLFRLDGTWYYLAAGRWFSAKDPSRGAWRHVETVPEPFARIPSAHPRSIVRASVPGTAEARMAALEASLPTQTRVDAGAAAPVQVRYSGAPAFEAIPGTAVYRAVNTGFDVLRYEGRFYLCYGGTWYAGAAAEGPWQVTASVPAAIYTIPPSSPSYHVTSVKLVSATPAAVVYAYPPAYATNVYVVGGVPYYGTGWYYPPYAAGAVYYPYAGTYGHGTVYNPATGGYASRSAWYGPYGGYSYTQGYNAATGRYGYAETAWDGDEWASHSQTYNPRTGVGQETSRYYDEGSNSAQMERTTTRNGESVTTSRSTDLDAGASTVERSASNGASTSSTRSASGGSTTVTGADGATATASTQRQDGNSRTTVQGSEGGQAASVYQQGSGRTTVGQSGSGDVYAGHNGDVYRKTDEGWQSYEDGEWSQAQGPQREAGQAQPSSATTTSGADRREAAGTASREQTPSTRGSYDGAARAGASGQRDFSRLDRDHASRQRGTAQFQQRSGGFQRAGGFERGGGSRRR